MSEADVLPWSDVFVLGGVIWGIGLSFCFVWLGVSWLIRFFQVVADAD